MIQLRRPLARAQAEAYQLLIENDHVGLAVSERGGEFGLDLGHVFMLNLPQSGKGQGRRRVPFQGPPMARIVRMILAETLKNKALWPSVARGRPPFRTSKALG